MRLLPGLALCVALSGAAVAVQAAERAAFGTPHLDPMVLAILLGMAVAALRPPGPATAPGVAFAAKPVLELTVALLGLSVTFDQIFAAGPALLLAILAVVVLAIATGYALCRLCGLERRMAVLVACGNAVCGNSAIAAVAPAIRAAPEDVASAITFSAVMGVAVVLLLPVLMALAGLSETQYGVLAGLTIYAVPQVLAATAPVGVLSAQVGTVVKLVRVLTLGPVVLAMSLLMRRDEGGPVAARGTLLHQAVPWFVPAFLALAAARSAGVVPDAVAADSLAVTRILSVVAMAGLGLCVDVRHLWGLSGRLTLAVTASLGTLIVLGFAAITVLGVA